MFKNRFDKTGLPGRCASKYLGYDGARTKNSERAYLASSEKDQNDSGIETDQRVFFSRCERSERKCWALTVATSAENLEKVIFSTEQDVIYSVSNPITFTGGNVEFVGELAQKNAAVNADAIKSWQCGRTACCFKWEEVPSETKGMWNCEKGERIVSHISGSVYDPDLRGALLSTIALLKQGDGEKIVVIAEDLFSGGEKDVYFDHAESEQAIGGPIPLIQDGHLKMIDVVGGDLGSGTEELDNRKSKYLPPVLDDQSGNIGKYAKQVGAARTGAVTHPGGRKEVVCYADI